MEATKYNKKEGIPANIFIKVCKVMNEKHHEIIKRIMLAIDLSLDNKDSIVGFEDFLKLQSLLKFHSATK